jgi:hypothetical protein
VFDMFDFTPVDGDPFRKKGSPGAPMGYPAAGVGPLAWATDAPTVEQANQALAGVFNEQKQQPASIGGWGAAYNNPGNLEKGKKGGWTSQQPGYQPAAPGRFATFDTMQHGLDALQTNLRAYAARGIDTPAAIAKPWAPPFENNTALYGGVLANAAGVPDVNTRLNMSDPWTYNRLASGVGQIEMGVQPSKITNAIASAPQNQVFVDAANAALMPNLLTRGAYDVGMLND